MRLSVLLPALALALATTPDRGAAQPAAVGRVEAQTITSKPLGATRGVTIYLPPDWAAGRTYPVIYMADGQAAAAVVRVLEPLIAAGKVRPVLLVGLHAAADGEQRHRDYLPLYGGGEAAFVRHMRFFLDEVMPLAEAKYGASTGSRDRLLLGFSDGASWAVATGLRRPKLFGRVAALSLGWPDAGRPLDGYTRPKFWLGCGTGEGVFRAGTQGFATSARAAGYNVQLTVRSGAHGQALWTPMYADVLQWAFPAQGA